MPVEDQVADAARRARVASIALATATRATKDAALESMADALVADADAVLAANALDVAAAERAGTGEHLVDRLRLDVDRVGAMAQGLRDVARLPDPVGEVVRGSTLANGLELRQVRVPFGVVGIIYEARPNVTADAAGICLKSGNAVLLRGSSSALRTNTAVVDLLRDAAAGCGLPADVVQLVPGEGHEAAKALMRARGLVDVLIPRGGAGLIRSVVTESTVPVIETGVGNCHVYVDAAADLDLAERIVLNSKTDRTSVCNAAESLLVHADVADEFCARIVARLQEAGVLVHGDPAFAALPGVAEATDEDYAAEYLALEISAAVVPDLDAAIEHIRRYSSGHSEAIVTRSQEAARRFVAEVDSAVVLVNASTRFTDGGEFGFGAEIGISTQKLHARGPMGLPEMTSTKYVVTGAGHTPVKLFALTLVFGMVSSVIPVFNMETYVVVAYAKSDATAFQIALVASLGQNIGKLVWYYACRQSVDLPWLRRRIDTPRRQAQFERWSAFVQGRPGISGLLTFVSALIGVPPFFAMAMIAGTLRMNVVVFFLAGFAGRTLFFWAILGGAHLLLR